MPSCIYFFLGMVFITVSCTMSWTSNHSSSGTLSIRSNPWICLSLPLYNCKGFDLGHTWMVTAACGFPYFLQFKPEFGNKEFMIWAIVSSQFFFCWLYRASPSLAAKNIIKLISVLTFDFCTFLWCRVSRMLLLFRSWILRPGLESLHSLVTWLWATQPSWALFLYKGKWR